MQRYQISSQMATEISSDLSLTRCRQSRKVSIHDDLSNGSFILKDISAIVSNDLVKLLGIAIDVKINFCLHVGSFLKCWTLLLIPSLRFPCTLHPFATRPCVNWMLWPKYLIVLDLSDRKTIYESSVARNLNHCLLVWSFSGATSSNKLEKIRERCLRIIYRNCEPPYKGLLQTANTISLCHFKTSSHTTWNV